MTERSDSAASPVVARPLLCPSCKAPVPLGDGERTTCPYCGTSVAIPADYVELRDAARRDSADRAEASRLYARLGRPPGPALRLWGALARATQGFAWTVFEYGWILALILLPVVPFVLARHAASWIGVDLMDRFGGPAFALIVLAVFVLLIVVPAALSRNATDKASVRLALQQMLAARAPEQPGGVTRCRRCGAPLTVSSGALGARCDYCRADNLVALPAKWLEIRNRRVARDHDAITAAADDEKRVRATGARRLRTIAVGVLVAAPLAAVAGHVFPGQRPAWSRSHGTPRAMLRVGHPDERVQAGRVTTLACDRSATSTDAASKALDSAIREANEVLGADADAGAGANASEDSTCSASYWVALGAGERMTLRTPRADPDDIASVVNLDRVSAMHWKRSGRGDWVASFRAPYTGYFEIQLDFLHAGRRVPLTWTPGDSQKR
jgi:DNA-directed RNA polymerase subunit RPC12/RpoP